MSREKIKKFIRFFPQGAKGGGSSPFARAYYIRNIAFGKALLKKLFLFLKKGLHFPKKRVIIISVIGV